MESRREEERDRYSARERQVADWNSSRARSSCLCVLDIDLESIDFLQPGPDVYSRQVDETGQPYLMGLYLLWDSSNLNKYPPLGCLHHSPWSYTTPGITQPQRQTNTHTNPRIDLAYTLLYC